MLGQHVLEVWRTVDCVVCGAANGFAAPHDHTSLDAPFGEKLKEGAPGYLIWRREN